MADQEESAPIGITHVQALRDDVYQRYSAVAHLLSESQRRCIRRHLAQMTAIALQTAQERPNVRLAMARASSAAPVITDAVLKLRA